MCRQPVEYHDKQTQWIVYNPIFYRTVGQGLQAVYHHLSSKAYQSHTWGGSRVNWPPQEERRFHPRKITLPSCVLIFIFKPGVCDDWFWARGDCDVFAEIVEPAAWISQLSCRDRTGVGGLHLYPSSESNDPNECVTARYSPSRNAVGME